jgi:hypothetical protein
MKLQKQWIATVLGLSMSAATLLISGCGNSDVQTAEAANGTAPDAQQPAGKEKGFLEKLVSKPEPITIAAGTPVTIRLQNTISSATAQPGDMFDFTLIEPLVVNGRTVASSGAAGVGRVVAAKASGRLHNAGYLRIAMSSIEVDGKQVPVQSSSIFLSGGRYVKRNTAIIGGSAAGGAVVGGLLGGGKGALIGAGVGAGAGTATAAATGKKEVTFAAERALTFKITQPVTVQM